MLDIIWPLRQILVKVKIIIKTGLSATVYMYIVIKII